MNWLIKNYSIKISNEKKIKRKQKEAWNKVGNEFSYGKSRKADDNNESLARKKKNKHEKKNKVGGQEKRRDPIRRQTKKQKDFKRGET